MTSRRDIWTAALLVVGAAVPARGQVDEQTREIMERDRRYYERQTQKEEEADAPDEGEARRVTVKAFLADADRVVRDRNYASRTTAHYLVQTDDPRLDISRVAELLDSFQQFFGEFWADRAALNAYEETGRVFLFYSKYKFNRLTSGRELFDTVLPAGHYRPYIDVVMIHTDSVPPGTLPDVVVHEAAHQLLANRLFGRQAVLTPWVAEGVATYFGYTLRDRSGQWVPGGIGSKGFSLLAGDTRPPAGGATGGFEDLRRALRSSEPPSIPELVAMRNPREFYPGPGLPIRYSASWALVHLLFHGEDGAHAADFVRYLAREAAGEGSPEALYAELAMSPEQLETAFRKHVRELKSIPKKRAR